VVFPGGKALGGSEFELRHGVVAGVVAEHAKVRRKVHRELLFFVSMRCHARCLERRSGSHRPARGRDESSPVHDPLLLTQTNGVEPGIGTSRTARSPNAYDAGDRSSCDCIACSHDTCLPVYALMRPMIA